MYPKLMGNVLAVSILFLSLINQIQAQSWTQLTATGGPPYARNAQSAIYDSVNNRMTIFGGYTPDTSVNYLNDVWILTNANGLDSTTSSWIQPSISGLVPSPRYGNSVAYDTFDNTMIVYGGWTGNTVFGDFWDLGKPNDIGGSPNWSHLVDGAAGARYGHSAIFDNANKLMTVFGGYDGTTYYNDTWVVANVTDASPNWAQLSPTNLPPPRYAHTAIYDATNNLMTVFGGRTYVSSHYLNDVWVLSNANGVDSTTPTWTELTTTGGPPAPRYYHTAVYDAASNRMIVYGGWDGTTVYNDLWVLSHANGLGGTPTWSQLSTSGNPPGPLYGHSAVYDNVNKQMILFGGYDGSTYHNDSWVLNLSSVVPVKDWMLYR